MKKIVLTIVAGFSMFSSHLPAESVEASALTPQTKAWQTIGSGVRTSENRVVLESSSTDTRFAMKTARVDGGILTVQFDADVRGAKDGEAPFITLRFAKTEEILNAKNENELDQNDDKVVLGQSLSAGSKSYSIRAPIPNGVHYVQLVVGSGSAQGTVAVTNLHIFERKPQVGVAAID